MTVDQWGKELRQKVAKAIPIAYEAGVVDATGRSAVRIFEKGKAFSGKIGEYNDDDPIYIALKNSPKKFPIRKFKKGGKAKGRTFKSYKDYRSTIGRDTGFVNLRLSNELFSDYANTKLSKTSNPSKLPVAFPVEVNKFHYKIVLNKSINSKKRAGMEDHFKKRIFGINKKELKKMNKVIQFELDRRLT